MSIPESIIENAALTCFGELSDAVGHGLRPSPAMSRPFPAPTGHHAIALGIRPQTIPRPEGAQRGTGIRRGVFRGDGFRPFRAGNHFWDCAQSVDLGYRTLPQWGRTRGDALGDRILSGRCGNPGGIGSGGRRRIQNGCRVMFRLFPAPKGHHAIAHGNALGIRPKNNSKP